jgi:uncharacterized hydrophobic protein (TIGR00341 family)
MFYFVEAYKMPLRLIEITAPESSHAKIKNLAQKHNAIDYWYSAKNKDGRRSTEILTHLENIQSLTDDLQKNLFQEDNWRIVILPVETTLPELEQENGNESTTIPSSPTIPREVLYNEVRKGAQTDSNFLLLVILSTLVCAIGLIKNNVAVVIGAMVIAPLLGPILAVALGAALGDRDLMKKSIYSNFIGLGITLVMAIITGLLISTPLVSQELMDRTNVSYDSLILALASGAAAVLSLTTGLSSTLVGVMVAVALMPPAVSMGIFIGDFRWLEAYNAGLLLTANVVCVSIAAQFVFLYKGIKPRTWYMRKKSKQSVKLNLICWAMLLFTILILIFIKGL